MLATRAADDVAIVVYNNLVGGQDELVFDGNSMVFDEEGTLLARGKQFSEDLVVVDLDIESVHRARLQNTRWRKQQMIAQGKGQQPARIDVSGAPLPGRKPPLPQRVFRAPEPPGEVYDALVTGSRDYIKKNGFKGVVIGLSGGIDSSLVAAIAVDALGAANVTGVVMSSIYSSAGSITDAEKLAANLDIKLLNIPIKGPFDAYREALAEAFAGTKKGVAEENIQARIRGNILMALSNRFGWLVLTTGNKSEFATGYTTLYGDMAGGFAVIKDVYKTMAYRLAAYRNSLAGFDLIPESVMQKVPSAELRPGQKDSDNLPPYDLLDPILKAYVEEDKSVEQIIALGYDKAVVKKVARLVDGSEYKRRQAPPGVKITPKAFGRDRRLPITNRFQS
jgi:NAD+ synthase (glutamine-hydrolysing)